MSEYRTTYDRVFKGANENFKGNKLNEEKHEAYETILKLAKDLSNDHNSYKPIEYGFTNATDESRHAMVYIDVKPPFMASFETEKVIATMAQLADDIVVAATRAGRIRLSFAVRDIWSD